MRLHLLALGTAALAGACSSTMGTTPQNTRPGGSIRAMNYALPETRLRFYVIPDTGDAPPLPQSVRPNRNGGAASSQQTPQSETDAPSAERSAHDPPYTISDMTAFLVQSDAHRYTLSYDPASGSNDKLSVETDDNGFLRAIELNRQDESAAIMRDLSSFVRTAVSGLPSAGRAPGGGTTEGERAARELQIVEAFQFNPDHDLPALNRSLEPYRLKFVQVGGACPNNVAPDHDDHVVYYAQRTPRLLALRRVENPSPEQTRAPQPSDRQPVQSGQTHAEQSPDNQATETRERTIAILEYETTNCAVGAFDVERFDWVNSQLKLTFADGILTRADITKPSEAAAAARVPLMVADNILGIARDLLTVRVQTINSEAAVLGAQKSKYEAQADALRAYEALVQQVDQARANEAERRRREQTSPAPPPQPPPAPQETVPKRSDGEGSGAVPEYED